ncbi:hypothetical protein GQ44DRAFT_726801 [Phaeosphaeriaceae sp. PMI808]|nr:hypothetical protein GQ44DRAFT_726801 [Phaeosphaeriaceae sp. PMI808]
MDNLRRSSRYTSLNGETIQDTASSSATQTTTAQDQHEHGQGMRGSLLTKYSQDMVEQQRQQRQQTINASYTSRSQALPTNNGSLQPGLSPGTIPVRSSSFTNVFAPGELDLISDWNHNLTHNVRVVVNRGPPRREQGMPFAPRELEVRRIGDSVHNMTPNGRGVSTKGAPATQQGMAFQPIGRYERLKTHPVLSQQGPNGANGMSQIPRPTSAPRSTPTNVIPIPSNVPGHPTTALYGRPVHGNQYSVCVQRGQMLCRDTLQNVLNGALMLDLPDPELVATIRRILDHSTPPIVSIDLLEQATGLYFWKLDDRNRQGLIADWMNLLLGVKWLQAYVPAIVLMACRIEADKLRMTRGEA